ncbi:MAG: signal peptidase I [Oscillibacter sp.]|nr:signal peptidase I [Oscillibacter sp.]
MKPGAYRVWSLCALAAAAAMGILGGRIRGAGWAGIVIYSLLPALLAMAPRPAIGDGPTRRRRVAGVAAAGGAVLLAIRFVLAVVMKKLAASPYDISPAGIWDNLLWLLPCLLGQEMTRAYALGNIRCRPPRQRAFWTAAVYVLLLAAKFPWARCAAVQSVPDAFLLLGQYLLPLAAQGMVLMVLAAEGGAGAAVAYAAIPVVFEKMFPFLPSLPWLAETAVGTAFPVALALYIRSVGTAPPARRARPGSTAVLAMALCLLVGVSWFSAGVFPVRPLVVLTGSMEPGIMPGDVVLVRRFTGEEEISALTVGDVINFQREDINITHRIADVKRDSADNLTFYTKGDNNESRDSQALSPNDINGIVVRVIPKVGWPVLLLWSGRSTPAGVETGS